MASFYLDFLYSRWAIFVTCKQYLKKIINIGIYGSVKFLQNLRPLSNLINCQLGESDLCCCRLLIEHEHL